MLLFLLALPVVVQAGRLMEVDGRPEALLCFEAQDPHLRGSSEPLPPRREISKAFGG